MSKRDRQGVRTPAGLERKYDFDKRFKNAMEAAAEASEDVKKLNESMDQTEIFNRLTKHGKAQGLFLDNDGNVYVNASYLTTGVLKSLDGTTFYLDLVKGILKGQFTEFSISGKTVEQIALESSDKAQLNAELYADKVAQNAVESQTQVDVFNKLTNNGNAQGIFYQNGQLYINASYLSAGVLKTADDDTFHLDLSNNELKILGKTVEWKENDDGTFYLVGK